MVKIIAICECCGCEIEFNYFNEYIESNWNLNEMNEDFICSRECYENENE